MAKYTSVPTVKQLAEKVKLVEVDVTGRYIASVGKTTESHNYEVKVLVPEGFNLSDVKRATPKEVRKKHSNFRVMRDFTVEGKAKKTDKVVARKELYSQYELDRFAKVREKIKKDQEAEDQAYNGRPRAGVANDTTEYDDRTGLPPLVEDLDA